MPSKVAPEVDITPAWVTLNQKVLKFYGFYDEQLSAATSLERVRAGTAPPCTWVEYCREQVRVAPLIARCAGNPTRALHRAVLLPRGWCVALHGSQQVGTAKYCTVGRQLTASRSFRARADLLTSAPTGAATQIRSTCPSPGNRTLGCRRAC